MTGKLHFFSFTLISKKFGKKIRKNGAKASTILTKFVMVSDAGAVEFTIYHAEVFILSVEEKKISEVRTNRSTRSHRQTAILITCSKILYNFSLTFGRSSRHCPIQIST